MRKCLECKYADWKKTAAGRMHPSGDGRCTYEWKMPPLPASRYFVGIPPTAMGGYISRGKDLEEHCVYWTRVD